MPYRLAMAQQHQKHNYLSTKYAFRQEDYAVDKTKNESLPASILAKVDKGIRTLGLQSHNLAR